MTSERVTLDFVTWASAARPRLVRTATALTAGDAHLAEDVVQTALAKTYLAWDRIGTDRNVGRHPDLYVRTVLVRAFVDETRRPWWRREHGTREVREDDGPTGGSSNGGGPGAGPEDVWAVRDALAALPHDMRLAVVLRYWLGCDVAEAAALADCSEATLRSRAFRGLARLRADLGDLMDGDEPDGVRPDDSRRTSGRVQQEGVS